MIPLPRCPFSRLNDEARRLLEELGSTAAKELSFRDSWVFVGAKGIENKSPFEQVTIADARAPSCACASCVSQGSFFVKLLLPKHCCGPLFTVGHLLEWRVTAVSLDIVVFDIDKIFFRKAQAI